VPSAVPQPVVAQLKRAAIFLVATVNPGQENESVVRAPCGDLAALLRAVGFRDLEGRLSCVMAFGSEAWDRLFGEPKPKELHPFREIRGQYHAVATPADILFHIRATRMDLCFELATQIMSRLNGAVSTVDEVHGFKLVGRRATMTGCSTLAAPSPARYFLCPRRRTWRILWRATLSPRLPTRRRKAPRPRADPRCDCHHATAHSGSVR
jgi:deferrochelatase/peroxidase EfeB